MIFKKLFYLIFATFLFCSNTFSQITIPDKVKQGIVIDHSSGAVLVEKNADQKISPASMTKIMTAVVVFDQLKNKKIKLLKGDLLIFPSIFLYPHKVEPVKKGTRYSFISWVY